MRIDISIIAGERNQSSTAANESSGMGLRNFFWGTTWGWRKTSDGILPIFSSRTVVFINSWTVDTTTMKNSDAFDPRWLRVCSHYQLTQRMNFLIMMCFQSGLTGSPPKKATLWAVVLCFVIKPNSKCNSCWLVVVKLISWPSKTGLDQALQILLLLRLGRVPVVMFITVLYVDVALANTLLGILPLSSSQSGRLNCEWFRVGQTHTVTYCHDDAKNDVCCSSLIDMQRGSTRHVTTSELESISSVSEW